MGSGKSKDATVDIAFLVLIVSLEFATVPYLACDPLFHSFTIRRGLRHNQRSQHRQNARVRRRRAMRCTLVVSFEGVYLYMTLICTQITTKIKPLIHYYKNVIFLI